MLNKNSILLNLAKDSITDKLNNTNSINKDDLLVKFPEFKQKGATFITLNIDGKLRGCIGSLIAHQNLFDDITQNAKKAAFNDPRFQPLTKEEFANTTVEISLLSQPKQITFSTINELKEKIEVGIDGLIIRQGNKQATFLPQVWEQLPSFDIFMNHLYKKAGITSLENGLEAFKYQVEKIK